MISPGRLLTLSNRVYCLLLYLYPASFRREYGYDMAQLFRDDVRGTLRARGSLAVTGLWALALVDLLKTALAEHIWEIFHMPVDRLTRWSGPAGAIGGLLYGMGIVWILELNSFARNTITYSALVFLVSIPFLVLGLYGVYKCLPARTGHINMLAFVLSVVGLLIGHGGTAVQIIAMSDAENVWFYATLVGGSIYLVGFAGLGLVAITSQALGRWSFAPLLVPVTLVGLLSFGTSIDPRNPIITVLLSLYTLSWLLLGLALWRSYREPPEPGLFA